MPICIEHKKVDSNKLSLVYKKDKTSSEDKNYKIFKKRKISFFTPNIKSIHSENNLKLHLYLYDTFKKFGEAYSGNVLKKIKNIKYSKY